MIYRQIACDDWVCDVYFALNEYWGEEIISKFEGLNASAEILERIDYNMRRNKMDTGFTFSNPYMHHSIMVIGRSSSGAELLNSFSHEVRHLVDDISAVWGLAPKGEAVAYLTGDVSALLSDIVCKLSCSCHRKRMIL